MTRTWQPVSIEEAKSHRLYGVRGWLLFLVVGMMVLGPLFGAARLMGEFLKVEREFAQVVTLPEWHTYKSATWMTLFATQAVSIYGAWGLVRGRAWSVVRRAQAALWIVGPGAFVLSGGIIPMLVFHSPTLGIVEFALGLVLSALGALLWVEYLSRAKRVRITYDHSVPSSVTPAAAPVNNA